MPETNETKSSGATPAKNRSPNYPAIGPTKALEFGQKIWSQAKRSPMTTDMACQYMGYKTQNGASLPIVAALRRYGILVPGANGEVKISEEAHTIFIAPPELPERKGMIARLAMRPSLFREVLSHFPDGLPTDAHLRFQLQRQWEFTTAKAADAFIKALRDAVEIADLARGIGNGDSDSEVNAEESQQMSSNQAIAQPSGQGAPRLDASPTPPMTPPASGLQARTWDLGGGAMVALTLPLHLSRQNVARLRKYVEALANEASIAWDDDEAEAG